MKKLQPELRFKEFSEDWKKLELGNLIEISKDKYNPLKSNENYKCIELEHLSQKTGKLLGYSNSKEQQSIKNVFKKNQVLYGKLRPYLKKYLNPNFDGVCSSEIWVLNGINISNNFLYELVKTHKFNLIANVSSGSKMPRSDWNYMKEIPFGFPSTREQEKVALFLSSINKKIEKLTDKKELLDEYKKGTVQKIFSQEIRFKDESGEEYPGWKVKKLVELSKLVTKQTGYDYTSTIKPSLEAKKNNLNIPFIQNKDFNSRSINLNTDYYIPTSIQEKYPKITLDEKCLLITISGKIGNVGVYDKSEIAFIGGAVGIVKFLCKENIDYVKYYLNSSIGQKMILREVKSSSHKNITVEGIRNFRINLPPLEEQKKIVSFLSAIDKKLEILNTKIDEMKEFKKGLLQQMFV